MILERHQNGINSPKPRCTLSPLWVGGSQPDDLDLTLNVTCLWLATMFNEGNL